MHILNQLFDRIYCLTVFSFTERHKAVRESFREVDFEWILSPPADTLAPSPDITLTEKSIIIGYSEAIQNATLNGFDKIAIIEDDSRLIATEEEIGVFFKELPTDWEFLYMGDSWWASQLWSLKLEPYSDNVNRILHGNGTAFVGMRSTVYKPMLRDMGKYNNAVDLKINSLFECRRKAFCPKKWISRPMSGPDEKYRHHFTEEQLKEMVPSMITHTI